MVQRGEIEPLSPANSRELFLVTVPYARTGAVDEYEVLMEAHPYAALAYLSALVFHELTDQLPKEITAITPIQRPSGLLPPGTEQLDWEGIARVPAILIPHIFDRPVHWIRVSSEKYFGIDAYRPQGYPVSVTTPERTLIDGLRQPELSGGIENVLQAWVTARDLLDLERVLEYSEKFNIAVLRQRVGYVLEALGFSHTTLEGWRTRARRGGSSKLVGSEPYAPVYSERWNLSLNASVVALEEGSD